MSSDHSDLDFGATIRGLASGQKLFGRYTLKKMLGRGGMGIVWLARDESLERDIAIKMLPEVVASDPSAVRDLKRETSRSQQLSHPHILRIFDFVEAGQHCGITMEVIEGGTLTAKRLEAPGEVLSVAQLSGWVRQMCEGLDYAHQEVGIVHRDLKPANLMLDGRGRLKITDFGIARSITDSVSRVSRMSAGGGSLPYMSPQQLHGEKPAVSDDIYALGSTLYELLTGNPPFYSGGMAAIMHQVQSKVAPSLEARRKDLGVVGEVIPSAWEETIAACLAKDAAARPQSAGEVAERLGLVTRGSGSKQSSGAAAKPAPTAEVSAPKRGFTPPTEPSFKIEEKAVKSKGPLYLALVAAVFALGGGVYYWGRDRPEQGRKADLVLLEQEAKRAAGDLEKARLVAGEAAAKVAAAAKAQEEVENNAYREIITKIAAVADGATVAMRDSTAGAVTNYTASAPVKYRVEVETRWKERLAGWDAARRAAAEAAAKVAAVAKAQEAAENQAYREIVAKIEAVADGTTAALRDSTAGAVTKYTASAPAKYRAEVETQWTQRLAGWEAARQAADEAAAKVAAAAKAQEEAENKAYQAILAKIEAVADGATAALRDSTAGAVTNYTGSAPLKYRGEVETLWKQRLAGWEAARLAAARGGIIVKTEPAGAEVTVGALEHGVSPVTVKDAKLGRYPVKAKLTGYEEYSGEVEVKENEFSEVTARLVRSTGSVAITSEPSGLSYELSSSGEKMERGTTPATLGKVPTGNYTLTVARSGWPEVKQTVKVERGVEAKGQAAFIGGNLEVSSEPSGAEVYKAGQKIGITPLSFKELPPSDFEFELRLQAYKSATVRGKVRAKETARTSAKLEKKLGAEVGQRWTIPALNLVMVPIGPGTFTMGSATGSVNEKPLTQVTLTRAYWLGATEVTQAQYAAVMGTTPSNFKGDNLPVEQVSWEEAMEYGRKLTERERAAGRLPDGYVYTLPSEAQWEYACRAGTTGDYAGSLEAMGWYRENSASTTHAVGTKQANAWGLFDMHGNVREWCADAYADTLPGGSVTDPRGAASGSGRVYRGGGFLGLAAGCRSAVRIKNEPDYRFNNLGFRLALSSVP